MFSQDQKILEKLSFVMSFDTGMLNADQMESLAKNQMYSHRMKEAKLRYLSQKAIFEDKQMENQQEEENEPEDDKKPFTYQKLSNVKAPISKVYSKINSGNMTTSDIRNLIKQLQSFLD